jgi:hypothetical protein
MKDFTPFYNVTALTNDLSYSLQQNQMIEHQIRERINNSAGNDEYNRDTKTMYYEQYIKNINITLGILVVLYSIYSLRS